MPKMKDSIKKDAGSFIWPINLYLELNMRFSSRFHISTKILRRAPDLGRTRCAKTRQFKKKNFIFRLKPSILLHSLKNISD